MYMYVLQYVGKYTFKEASCVFWPYFCTLGLFYCNVNLCTSLPTAPKFLSLPSPSSFTCSINARFAHCVVVLDSQEAQ